MYDRNHTHTKYTSCTELFEAEVTRHDQNVTADYTAELREEL